MPIVVGASVLCLFFFFFIFGILWWKGCLVDSQTSREEALRGLDLQTGFFTLRQIKAATNNFDPLNKIAEGGFGCVYKAGILLDGTTIAVKQLFSKLKQGNREFVNEIGMISGLHHPNVALVLQQKGDLMELVDPKLNAGFNREEALRMIKVALLCANSSPALRPTLSEVVSMLEGRTVVHEVTINPSIYDDEMRFKAFTEDSDPNMEESFEETRSLIHSNSKWTASSSSSVLNIDTVKLGT
ncbi:putative protein kinase RLK-Pelle-DLSV family [Rosa chinensis]|uniref:Protein kinase domain-containing protein n=1 Tax=Rosa chinensis TaxID=74649 RepID=A0A2P6Q526_ROSCH|nr:putative protein kinase RLK-Pelle-DLSV family [Rosa chinensis]